MERLGADEIIEYDTFAQHNRRYRVIIDTIGGKVLEGCWSLVSETGTLISIDIASFNFVDEHRKLGLAHGAENVKALFFIVSPSRADLQQLSRALELGLLEPFVAGVLPLKEAARAYADVSIGSDAPR